jgi:hypothetical protein
LPGSAFGTRIPLHAAALPCEFSRGFMHVDSCSLQLQWTRFAFYVQRKVVYPRSVHIRLRFLRTSHLSESGTRIFTVDSIVIVIAIEDRAPALFPFSHIRKQLALDITSSSNSTHKTSNWKASHKLSQSNMLSDPYHSDSSYNGDSSDDDGSSVNGTTTEKIVPCDADVLLGRGTKHHLHPGNKRYNGTRE